MVTMACRTALAGRRAPVKANGAAGRRRSGRAREDFVLETIYWDADTARLLPREHVLPPCSPNRHRWQFWDQA